MYIFKVTFLSHLLMRPCEMRNDLLNRWVRMKREEKIHKTWEKPTDPNTVLTLGEAEKWRKRVADIIGEKLERLYTEPLKETETKYLNDMVNKEMRELRRWETRIIELGGIDYSRVGLSTPNGDILNTNLNQYQYFGRARTLPGVQMLIESENEKKKGSLNASKINNLKTELMEKVNADYYGLIHDESLCSDDEYNIEMENGASNFDPDPIIESLYSSQNN